MNERVYKKYALVQGQSQPFYSDIARERYNNLIMSLCGKISAKKEDLPFYCKIIRKIYMTYLSVMDMHWAEKYMK